MTKFYISCTKCGINLAPSAVQTFGASAYCTKCHNDVATEDYIDWLLAGRAS